MLCPILIPCTFLDVIDVWSPLCLSVVLLPVSIWLQMLRQMINSRKTFGSTTDTLSIYLYKRTQCVTKHQTHA
jgi:hypothetical protein